jgi:hypothetical protein
VESDNHHPTLKQYDNSLQPLDSLFALPFDVITDLTVSEDGAWMVGSYQGKTKLFGATRSMNFIKQFTLPDEALSGTAVAADEGRLIIAGTDDRTFVKTIDIATENGAAANRDVEVQEVKVDSFYTTLSIGCPPGLTCLDIHYSLEVTVKNNGTAQLEQLYLNHYPGGGFNCSFPVAYNGYSVQVAPGNTETVILAGGVKTSIPTTSFPKTFDICVFSSGPDEVLDKNRTNDTACTTHTFTGINEVSREHFRIYPNPANNVVYISFAGEEAAVAEVFNGKGQLIKQAEIVSSTPIQISDLLPGIYFVKLTSGTATRIVKFVKQD